MARKFARLLLPTPNRHVDAVGFDLNSAGDPARAFSRKEDGTAARKWVEHEVAATSAVSHGIGDHAYRFDSRVRLQVGITALPERVCAGIVPHVRPIAAFLTQAEI